MSSHKKSSAFRRIVPALLLLAGIVGSASLAVIAVQPAINDQTLGHEQEATEQQVVVAATTNAVESLPPPPPAASEEMSIQNVTGKIQAGAPAAASRAFSPLSVEWSQDESQAVVGGTVTTPTLLSSGIMGSTILTKQKMAFNIGLDISEDALVRLVMDNNSEDTQIFLIKAGAPSNVLIDFRSPSGNTTEFSSDGASGFSAADDGVAVYGLVGHNEWLASVPPQTAGKGVGKVLIMEISLTDAGFYPIVVELERVG